MDFLIEVSNFLSFVKGYQNKSVLELSAMLSLASHAKSKNYILAKALCGQYKGKVFFDSLTEHENVHLKTIQLNAKGRPKESMSFAPIDFQDMVNETWKTSAFYKYLAGRFLFFVFQDMEEQNILKKVFIWRIPEIDLEDVRIVWENTQKLVMSGSIIKEINAHGKVITKFPAESETRVCHVRPHGRNGCDLCPLPVRDTATQYSCVLKQSFWFNKNYIYQIVQESEE